MHYLCGESGALVYDLRAGRPVSMVSMEKDLIRLLWEAIRGRDVMPQIFSRGASLGNADQLVRMAHYQMGVYQESFDRVCTPVKDVEAAALEEGRSVEKVNFYHTSPEEREITYRFLMIMVGDADNDLEALKASGLAVAMGNANEHVKKVCAVQVADNNHGGCAQAIRRYLLGEDI